MEQELRNRGGAGGINPETLVPAGKPCRASRWKSLSLTPIGVPPTSLSYQTTVHIDYVFRTAVKCPCTALTGKGKGVGVPV